MFGNFHDKEYDGVVLRIPRWFIEMNEIGKDIDLFQAALEKCSKSAMYKDHRDNLYELHHYLDKKEFAEEAKNRAKKIQEERDNKQNALLNKEQYELEWVNKKLTFDNSTSHTFVLNGVDFDVESDVFTKHGIKSAFDKAFHDQVKTAKDLKDFCHSCGITAFHILSNIENLPDWAIDMNYSLFQSTLGWGVLGISINIIYVKTEWEKVKTNEYRYRSYPLIEKDGVFFINNYTKGHIPLPGFVRKGLSLIKL